MDQKKQLANFNHSHKTTHTMKSTQLHKKAVSLYTAEKMFNAGCNVIIFNSDKEFQSVNKTDLVRFLNSLQPKRFWDDYSLKEFIIFGCRVTITLETKFFVYVHQYEKYLETDGRFEFSDVDDLVAHAFKISDENVKYLQSVIDAQQTTRNESSDDYWEERSLS